MNFYIPAVYTQSQLALLNEEDIVFPYSDEYMVYLGDKHQYQLTRKAFEEMGYNLEVKLPGSNPDKINNFLKGLRVKVYNHIYGNSKTPRNKLNYMIAKRGIIGFTLYEYREEFKEAMLIQGIYALENGDISMVSGVDIDTMQNMSIDVIKYQERDFAKDAKKKLIQLGLNYYGSYHFIIKDERW